MKTGPAINRQDNSEEGIAKKWSHYADYQLKKEFLTECRKKCDKEIQAYMKCSSEHQFLMLFKCRGQNKIMNECTAQYSGDEHWVPWRQARIEKLVAEGKVHKSALTYEHSW